MTWFTKWSFKNKAAVGLLVVIALALGAMSYFMLPMEFLPEADNPQVTVTVIGPGQDARSMESNVTKPIEQAVAFVKGKKETFSTSGDGYAQVNLFFDSKTNMKEAAQEVQKSIDPLVFPEGVMRPFVIQLNTSMIPIAQITIGFEDGLTDRNIEIAEKDIVGTLQKVKGVAAVALYGKSMPQVVIRPNEDQLAEKGLAWPSLMGILQGRSLSASLGEQTFGGQNGTLNISAKIEHIDTLKQLPVAPGVVLQDVATVELKQAQESVSRANGKDILFAIVTKEANANAVAVGNEVQAAIDRLNETIPHAEIETFISTSEMVVTSVNSMLREVLLGALFATLIILLFLRNVRATLITIVSIPLSLAITLYLLDVSGVSLNIITLGGVAVAVGRLVDDSIVVIENIYRRLQREAFSINMLIDATKEVAGAITSSTIATVAVFLPMGLLRGSLQDFLLPFALTVTYSLLASLLVALTVVPLLSSVLLKNTQMKEHTGSRKFNAFLHWNLKYKWITLSLSLLVFVGSIAGYILMPKGALDTSRAEYVAVELKFPSDTSYEEVLEHGIRLEQELVAHDQAKMVVMHAGNSSEMAQWGNANPPNIIDLIVILHDQKKTQAFIDDVLALKEKFTNATLAAYATGMMGGSTASEYIDLIGDDTVALQEAARQVIDRLGNVEGIEKLTSNMDDTKPVFAFTVDPTLANAQEIAMQLSAMLSPMPIGQMEYNGTTATVLLDSPSKPESLAELAEATVMTASGPVKLSQVAKLETREEPAQLYHKDSKPYIRIIADVDPGRVSEIGAAISKEAQSVPLPDGVELFVGGASVDQADDFADLGMVALISIALVYLIMVLTFKTLRAPLVILFSLPLAAIGAVLGLLVSGINPDFTAMFGALMLIGIVVTNAIVLVDRIKQNEAHMPIREAILEAAATRMRPILMTAIATICAMLPLVFSTSAEGNIVSQSLAIVVIGGLVTATILTLVVVPCVYELFYFRKAAKQRLETRLKQNDTAEAAAG